MHDVWAVGGILSAFGLASAAGLNATLPLLAIGALARTGHLTIAGSSHWLTTAPALAVLAVLFVIDVVGDKIPGVDHVLHVVGTVTYPIAGAIAFGTQTGAVAHLPTPLAWALGLTTAGSFHLTRSLIRPVATATTAGIGNPVLSTIEDVSSAALTFLALVVPVLAVAAAALLAVAVGRRIRRRRRRQPAVNPAASAP